MTSNYDKAISVRLFFPPSPLSHKVGKMELEAGKKKKSKAKVSQLVKGKKMKRASRVIVKKRMQETVVKCVFFSGVNDD